MRLLLEDVRFHSFSLKLELTHTQIADININDPPEYKLHR
jgi:hypothetical protein